MKNPTNITTRGITRPESVSTALATRNPTPLILNLEAIVYYALDEHVLLSASVRHNFVKKILDGLENDEYYEYVHIFRESPES